MRFESVTAHAFGPFEDQTQEFAPGMTVVFGRNESGKTSWQAALYAGLCGIRRGRGQPRADDRLFRDRHRPWGGDRWEVSLRIHLDDGTHIELRHDLDGRVDCRATDLGLARDVSSDIINEGAPDGALWLALDRRSFPATALVRQAEVLAVVEKETAAELQHYLQRAVATRGVDATAREAIERLKTHRREHVGAEHVHSRPLARALRSESEATEALRLAIQQHADYLDRVIEAEDLQRRAAEESRHVRLFEAAVKDREAREWADRADTARQLAARCPTQPLDASESEERASEVVSLLDAWSSRPESLTFDGPSSDELERDIASLPESLPEGDLEPHPDVLAASRAYEDAIRSLSLHAAQEPQAAEALDASDASEAELRELARDLTIEVPELEPRLKNDLDRAQSAVDQAGSGTRVALAIGIVGALLGGGLALVAVVPGVLVAALAVAAALVLVLRGSADQARSRRRLQEVEALIGDTRYEASAAANRLSTARERAGVLGLPADPAAVRELADRVSVNARLGADHARWREQQGRLEDVGVQAMRRLEQALTGRGVVVDHDSVQAALDTYMTSCAERADVGRQFAARDVLERQLQARRAAEDAAERLSGLEERLRTTAQALEVEGESMDRLADGLRAWLTTQREERERLDEARRDWTKLQTLLDGRSLEELEEEAERRRQVADAVTSDVDPEEFSRAVAGLTDVDLDALRSEADVVARRAENAQGRVEQLARQIASVPEAEEELAEALAELERVRRLEGTLEKTIGFLEDAEERVNRSISPALSEVVKRWLPSVTEGRYQDVTVDPETLEVKICGPDRVWHSATLLSQGTAEPVYLLLRIAMAEHLARSGEACPLILDDVTVQCDHERSQAVMNCLHEISQERQVIAFTQEREVLSWAEENLSEPHDRLVRLESS